MFKRHYSTIILFSVAVVVCRAQEMAAGVNLGYSTFSMDNFKNFQQELAGSYPIEAKTVERFPAYFNYSFNYLFFQPSFYWGVVVGHTSTAGRISYSDYSGSINSDQLISTNYFGGVIAKKIIAMKNTNFYFGGQVLYCFNKLTLKEVDQIGSQISTTQLGFHSFNLASGGFLEMQHRVNKFIVRANVGVEFQIPGDIKYDANSNAYLVDSSGEKVKINTGGLRASVGILYRFKFK